MKRVNPARYTVLLLLTAVSLCCSGCWDRKELKTLAIIAGIGVDRAPDGKYILTFQIIKPSMVKSGSGSKGSSGGDGGETTSAVMVTSGESITGFGAGRASRLILSRNLYLPQSQVIVFGHEAVRQGVRSAYDLHARYPQKRFTEMVVVAKGTAKEALNAHNQIDKIPAIALVTLINDSYQWTGKVIATRSIDLFKYLISKTQAAVIPQVEVVMAPGDEKILKMSGTAVINKDHLVGELNDTETRGLLWTLGKVKRTLLEITTKRNQGFGSLEVTKAQSRLEPEIHGGKITMKISVNAEATLTDILVNQNWSTPERMRELGQMGSAIIRKDIWAAWKKARRLNADIYGFGEALNRKYPGEWKRLQNQWGRIFPKLKLAVKVETNVINAGELLKPPLPQ